ncbi:hypothetical protein Q6296_28890, partial [Klebsiella variicola]|uniref:hypothetical protein n=1 Tax=Klebsiella variicola TaxID=244366 RepID=UPI0027309002
MVSITIIKQKPMHNQETQAVGHRQRLDINLLANFVSSADLGNYLSVIRSNLPDAKSVYLSCRGGGMLQYIPA